MFLHRRKCHKLCSHHICWPPSVSRRDVLARGSNVLCLQAVSESPSPEKSSAQSSSSSSVDTQLQTSNENHLAADCTTSDQQRGVLSHDSFIPGFCFSCTRHLSHVFFFVFFPSVLLILYVVAGNQCLFLACFTDDSFLSESFPLENDANESSTKRNDASVEVKCLFNLLLRQETCLSFIGSSVFSSVFSVFSGCVVR